MNQRQGFTLLELLIALVVAFVIAAAVGASLYAGFAAWERLGTGCGAEIRIARALALLERDIASAYAAPDQPFIGEADGCEFRRLAAPGPDSPYGPPQTIKWVFEPATSSLTRYVAADERTAPETGSNQSFGPLPAASFTYLPAAEQGASLDLLQETWDSAANTNSPAAVHLRIGPYSRLMACRAGRAQPAGETR